MTRIDFSQVPLLEVARELLGQENAERSTAREKHFPGNSGLFVNTEKNLWYSHGDTVGGDVAGLVKHVTGCDFGGALSWLEDHGYAPPKTNGQSAVRPTPQKITDPWPTRDGHKFVEAFDYVDEKGDLVCQSGRYRSGERGKTFLQRRRSKSGIWNYEARHLRRVPYRLPELMEAVAAKKPIFIAEGEKKVDCLMGMGFAATCNAGGAGKWYDEHSLFLRDANVVILPDNDTAGERHYETVSRSLAGFGVSMRVLRLPGLPAGGDILDWVKGGGNADQLAQAANLADAPDKKADKRPWPKLDSAALHGLAGEVVTTILPHSEADKVALLIQFLVCAGSIMGRSYYYQVESDRHHANLFAVLVGDSSKARKGTSFGRIRSVVKEVDKEWADSRNKGGLSSGEGLINEVRDKVERWNVKDQTLEVVDPGVADKRLLVSDAEFAGSLAVMERHGNTLSPVLRQCWDGTTLWNMTKNSPLKSTEAHISTIGHITKHELGARLTRTDMANGFANRFLFLLVRRSKKLPFGGELSDSQIRHLGELLGNTIQKLPSYDPDKPPTKIVMDDEARRWWSAIYDDLSEGKPGMVGAVTARAEAQTIRLAMIYALLDGKTKIEPAHLEAGLAVWQYCATSAAIIFGDIIGDPVRDEIIRALRGVAPNGLTRTAISDLFGRHQTGASISAALADLLQGELVRFETKASGGRPIETWFALAVAK